MYICIPLCICDHLLSSSSISPFSLLLLPPQEEVVEKLQTEQKPLKEQLTKQSNRVNTLNASLQAKEKERKRVTEENEELVSRKVCSYSHALYSHRLCSTCFKSPDHIHT